MARITRADYETVSLTCDHCGKECVFNRREDFAHVGPYAGEDVDCPNCLRRFRLIGDTINEPYELFLFAARECFSGKRYMQAVASMAQAWEMFFAAFASTRYLYQPFFSTSERQRDLDRLNALRAQMDHELRRFTFWSLRNLLINTVVRAVAPKTLDEAAAAIDEIGSSGIGNDPPSSVLTSLVDDETQEILKNLQTLTIGQLRNRVLHRLAYRPLRTEVEHCLEDGVLLYRAKHVLRVRSFDELACGIG